MIDTHCHLTDPRLAEQLHQVLERASAAGVSRLITIGTDLDDDLRCIELCRAIPSIRCAVGVHPNHCGQVPREDLQRLQQLASDPAVVALGEMGLDYFHEFAPKARQRDFFLFQLDLARRRNWPVVIHCREATDDCLAILRDFPKIRGVFHCFTGSPDEARRILDAGFWVGFTGAVTFKKNDALREACRLVPLDRLLVETDAPYLSPEPVRKQKTNEPAFVMHVAAVVAQAKKISVQELGCATTANAEALFRWDVSAVQPAPDRSTS